MAPGAFGQTAKATANLLRSVVGATDMVKKQFDKAQDLRNQSEISEKRRGIRDSQGIFQNEMLKGPDGRPVPPEQWGPLWQERLKSEKEKLGLDDSKVPPVVKRALSEDFENFAGSSFIKISGAALKENLKRARSNFDRDTQFLIGQEDFEGTSKLADEAATNGVLTPEETEDFKRGIGLIKQKNDLDYSLESDPVDHLRKVRNGDFKTFRLNPVAEQKELKRTKAEIQKRAAQDVRDIKEIDEGGGIEDEEDLKTRLDESPYITEATKEAYLQNYRMHQPLALEEHFAIQDRIDANVQKFSTDPTYTQEDYTIEWNALNLLVDTYGKRTGTGAFRADLHNMRPSLFTEGKQNEAAAKKHAKTLVKPKAIAAALVRVRAAGMAGLIYIKTKPFSGKTLGKKSAAANARTKLELSEDEVLVRSALERGIHAWIDTFPMGEQPTEPEMKKWMDENADRISMEAMQKATATPEVLETNADKAKKWLPPMGVAPTTGETGVAPTGEDIQKFDTWADAAKGEGGKHIEVDGVPYTFNADTETYDKYEPATDPADETGFDPNSKNYDDATAADAGLKRDDAGHMGSLDPRTGMVLKGRDHPTWDKMYWAEKELGNTVVEATDGRYYSRGGGKLEPGDQVVDPPTYDTWKEYMDSDMDPRSDVPTEVGGELYIWNEDKRKFDDYDPKEEEEETEFVKLSATLDPATTSPSPEGASASTTLSPKGANAATPIRTTSDNLVDMVKVFEAGGAKDKFHSKAYWDYGQWSIGYGTKSHKGETITKAGATKRLNEELAVAAKAVNKYNKTYKWKPHELDALTSFAYNVGSIVQLTAKGTRSREQIAAKMLEYKRATVKGKRVTLKGLENRRKAERDLFLNGYPKPPAVAKR